MTKDKIKECIDLLNTDGINSKERVKQILQAELNKELLVQETIIEPKDVMFSAFFPNVNELTPQLREQCLYKIGRRIVEDSLQDLTFRVRQINLDDDLPPELKGIKVQARFKYIIEDVLKE